MRLGINGQRLVGRRTGVGRYIEFLLKEWNKLDIPFEEVTVYTSAPLNWQSLELGPRFRHKLVGKRVPNLIWENLVLPWSARSDQVLFCPSYTVPLIYPGKSVVTNLGIYEALPETFPWWHRLRFSPFFRYAANHAWHVLAISESAKEDLQRYYGTKPERVTVTPPAPGQIFHPVDDPALVEEVRRKYELGSTPYFLFVGKLSLRRHIPMLLEAFARLKKDPAIEHKLVLVGPNYLNLELEPLLKSHGLVNEVIYREFIPHPDLARVYNGATAFVLPSSHEGFSFTILEALASGTPVITLAHAALNELATQPTYTVENCEPEDFCRAMHEVALQADLRQKLREGGLASAANYSWQKTAQKTMQILTKAAEV